MEIDDKRNMQLIRDAMKLYEDGELIEVRDMLAEVVHSIDIFDIAMEISETPSTEIGYWYHADGDDEDVVTCSKCGEKAWLVEGSLNHVNYCINCGSRNVDINNKEW